MTKQKLRWLAWWSSLEPAISNHTLFQKYRPYFSGFWWDLNWFLQKSTYNLWLICRICILMYIAILGGGFKYFSCSPLFGGRFPIWLIFFQMGWFNHQSVYLFTSHVTIQRIYLKDLVLLHLVERWETFNKVVLEASVGGNWGGWGFSWGNRETCFWCISWYVLAKLVGRNLMLGFCSWIVFMKELDDVSRYPRF